MASLGKVSLGNQGDIAGAVTTLSESVKNIEKDFDTAQGFVHKYPTCGDFQGTSENTSVAETKEPLDGNSNGLSVSKDDDSSTAIVSTATPGESQTEHQADDTESVSNTHIIESLETGTPPTLPDVSKTEIQYLEGWEDLKHKTQIKRLNNEQPEKTDRLKEQDSCPETDSTYVNVALPSGDPSSKGLHESISEVGDLTHCPCRDNLEGFQEVVSSEMVEPPVNSAIPDRLVASDSALKVGDETERLKSDVKPMESALQGAAKQAQALQETIEKGHSELAAQKEFYVKALNEAKRAQACAEARADMEVKVDIGRQLFEASERESALVQTLDKLRRSLSLKEQQAAFRENMLRTNLEVLEKRCQDAEANYDELESHTPELRRLYRQMEELQHDCNMQKDEWMRLERSVHLRLQEAERRAVLEEQEQRNVESLLLAKMQNAKTKLSEMIAAQSEATKSLEEERQRAAELTESIGKERQRTAESLQHYPAAREMAATQEGRVKQLEEEVKQLMEKHARDIAEEKSRLFLLGQELKQVRASYENRDHFDGEQDVHKDVQTEHSANKNSRHLNPDVRYYLRGAIYPWEHATVERTKNNDPPPPSPERGKSCMTAASEVQLRYLLRQEEEKLAVYTTSLATLESTRDSLAAELVRTSTQYEKLRADTASLPRLRAELEILRRRQTSALELLRERDKQVEELRVTLADYKELYKKDIEMLGRKVEELSAE